MKKRLLQSDRMASLFIEKLFSYRDVGKYLVHEFVVMPHHFHLLITPQQVALERSMQFIKGSVSYEAGKRFGIIGEIWQTSYHDRRIRESAEYHVYRKYIYENPVKARLSERPEEYLYSSASGKYPVDALPQWLKPLSAHA